MSAHTTAPWVIGASYGNLKTEIISAGRAICTVWTKRIAPDPDTGRETVVPFPEGMAAANLISAAPELLAALKEANAFILAPAEDIKEGVLSSVRAAIAKAEARDAF